MNASVLAVATVLSAAAAGIVLWSRPALAGGTGDLARELLHRLDDEALARAVAAADAPGGIAWRDLDDWQRETLWRLVEQSVGALRPAAARGLLDRVRAEGLPELSFRWWGSREPGQGHRHRIQGTWFAIDYDDREQGGRQTALRWIELEAPAVR